MFSAAVCLVLAADDAGAHRVAHLDGNVVSAALGTLAQKVGGLAQRGIDWAIGHECNQQYQKQTQSVEHVYFSLNLIIRMKLRANHFSGKAIQVFANRSDSPQLALAQKAFAYLDNFRSSVLLGGN